MRFFLFAIVVTLREHVSFRLFCLALCGALCSRPAFSGDFLSPDQAFAFSSASVGAHTMRLRWEIAPGYHLYRDRISATDDNAGAPRPSLSLPHGIDKFDETLNKTVAIFQHELTVDLDMAAGTTVTVKWQGCADAGLC